MIILNFNSTVDILIEQLFPCKISWIACKKKHKGKQKGLLYVYIFVYKYFTCLNEKHF